MRVRCCRPRQYAFTFTDEVATVQRRSRAWRDGDVEYCTELYIAALDAISSREGSIPQLERAEPRETLGDGLNVTMLRYLIHGCLRIPRRNGNRKDSPFHQDRTRPCM